MILLAGSSAALLVAAALLSAQLTPRGAVAWLLAFCLLAWSLCIVTVGVAGLLLRDLSATTLFALSIGWVIAASLLAWRRPVAARARLASARDAVRQALSWPPAASAAFIVVLALLWRAILALRLPVTDLLGWQYHLVFVDVWLQANAIVGVPQNRWTDGWPATGELLTTWLSAFTRTDTFAGLTSWLPIPVAVVACIGLARTLGAAPRTSLLAGLLLGMTPAMLALSGTSYLDAAFTAAVLASWALGLRIIAGERDVSASLLFGIGAGLAFGLKPTSFALVLPIAVGVVAVLLTRGRDSMVARLQRLAAFGLPVLAFGASWYFKNLLVHGNPLFPVGLGPLAGLDAGSYGAPPEPTALVDLPQFAKVAVSWAFDWQLHGYAYNQRPGGFGHAWLAIVGLGLGGLYLLVRRGAWSALALVVAPAVIALAALSSPWYARYTLFLPGLALPLAALVLDRLPRAWRLGVGFGLVVVASISVVLANAYPNVRMTLPPGNERAPAYWSLILGGSTETAGFDEPPRCEGDTAEIPRGARVAVAEGFFSPHAVVGTRRDRILVEPPPQASDLESLVATLREGDVGWFVTRRRSELDAIATSAPDVFLPRGRLCTDGLLYELRLPAVDQASRWG